MNPWWWRLPLVAGAYLAAGRLGLALDSPSPFIGMFWPALGGALAVLVRWGAGCVPALLVGAMAVQLTVGAPPWLALGIALGNVGGPWAASVWLQRAGFNPQLTRRRDLWLLLGAGGLGATTITALNGASWLAATGRIAPADWPLSALQWWSGDTLGLLVAGVPLLTLSRRSLANAVTAQRRHASLALLTGALVLLVASLVTTPWLGLGALAWLLAVPVLLCALAMRAGLATASAAVLATVLGLVAATAGGLGPLAQLDRLQPGNGQLLLWAASGALAALMLVAHALAGELVRLDERWQLALAGSDLGVADWNLRTGESFTSACWRLLMGDPQGGQGRSLAHWLDQVHADDRAALDAALAPQTAPASPGLQRELRLRRGIGWHWFDLHLSVAERDDVGRPLRVVASLADVGDRHAAADRQQLSANVFMHLHEGLVVTDADLQVLDANPTYCRIVGIPRNELIGTVPALLRAGTADGLYRPQQASLFAALRSQGNWVGEVVERRRNGDPCALHITVSTVQASDGAPRHHVLVVSDVTEQRRQREQLERQTYVDELTRLPNRARLNQLLAEAMAATDRDGYLLAVCYLDLDHFKAINERHGHEAGDLYLAELANRLRGALRVRGTVWSDAAARLGGDEFVLLLRAGTVDEARSAVERVLRMVAQPVLVGTGAAPEIVTASVGATVYPLDASDADTLLRHADHAMYGVKQSGRNGFLFFDPEHSRRTEERVTAIGRVQDALDRHELLLYYQPKVDLRRGVVLGFEALLRWNHPDKGILPPAHFLPLIEHTGLSARVGDHVLARALDQLEAWQDAGFDLSVSVNITARHLQEPDFAQRLGELLARHKRKLGPRLELEMLETAALTDIGFTSMVLERCARLGVRWALDDFGTGYSTLTYLKRLPVQVLKIDRSFVHNMLADPQDRAIVENVINLSHTFDCLVVAEGVETAAQARMLLDMGCEIGQGMGIAAPMPASEVLAWVRNWKGLFALTAAAGSALADGGGIVVDADDALPPPRGHAGD
ncbi:MAG: EAL domain-containing protein [Aquabacterium sp.]|nr:EAL domain-containing protein [Aquabacterium sp.]